MVVHSHLQRTPTVARAVHLRSLCSTEYEDEDYYRTQVIAQKDVSVYCSRNSAWLSKTAAATCTVLQDGQSVSADIYVWKDHMR